MLENAEIKAIIDEATTLRGWIANSYAQVEYLLGDLINRCREFPVYSDQTASISHSAAKRVKKVRAMLAIAGPLSPYCDEIKAVLVAFEQQHELRNLLAHGFCAFHFTPAGDAGMVFSKFERANLEGGIAADIRVQRTLRLVDLQYHMTQMTNQAERALLVFSKVHYDFRWATDVA